MHEEVTDEEKSYVNILFPLRKKTKLGRTVDVILYRVVT